MHKPPVGFFFCNIVWGRGLGEASAMRLTGNSWMMVGVIEALHRVASLRSMVADPMFQHCPSNTLAERLMG
jgi:hypothetical protein